MEESQEVLGWIVGLGVLASYCIRFLSVFWVFFGSGYFLLGISGRRFWFRVVFSFYIFLGSGYFPLGYQRTEAFGFVLYSVSICFFEFSFGPVILSSNISDQ